MEEGGGLHVSKFDLRGGGDRQADWDRAFTSCEARFLKELKSWKGGARVHAFEDAFPRCLGAAH